MNREKDKLGLERKVQYQLFVPPLILVTLIISIFYGEKFELGAYNDLFNLMLCLLGIVFSANAFRLIESRWIKGMLIFLMLIFLYLGLAATIRIAFSGINYLG